MDKKYEMPQRNLRRFYIGRGTLKKTFRFTRQNNSFYFFGTLRFADYTYAAGLKALPASTMSS